MVDFDGGNITSDAGIIIVKQIDTELELSKKCLILLTRTMHDKNIQIY